jgi:tRNA(fMet)-specific endonuclease VapC
LNRPAKASIPANGRFLLDTNIIIGLLKRERPVTNALSGAAEVSIPVIAVGELYFGASHSGRPDANRAVLDRFLDGKVVLTCNLAVAREYGRLKSVLKAQGTPLPENDLWIAAIAFHHGLTVASRDRHFSEIAGLAVAGWNG